MMRTSLVILLLAAGVVLSGCRLTDNDAPASVGAPYTGPIPKSDLMGAVVGTVVLDRSGTQEAITGATVVATQQGSGQTVTTVTDRDGAFVFTRLPAGRWSFGAASPGTEVARPDVPEALSVEVGPTALARVGQIVLATNVSQRACVVKGHLKVEGESLAVGSVSIQVTGVDGALARTKLNPRTGAFTVTVPPSADGRSRKVSLAFVSPAYYLAVVQGVEVLDGTTVTLPADVALRPVAQAD